MLIRCLGCMQPFDESRSLSCPHCGYVIGTPAEEAIHIPPGSLLHGRYIVGRVLGYGGFGVTYIGWDQVLEQRVAIKEYLPGEFSTRIPGQATVTVFEGDKNQQFNDGLRKFVEEARHLAQFQNEPGIVKVFDSFEENCTAYIIMEYLEGQTLADYLKSVGTIPEDQAVAMLTPLMESLQVVHEKGILHRDIAPDNIFITTEGEVKLIDFGASRYATTSHSRSLTVIIKPGYSPEEQYRSRGDQGPHTDVYALGATLYKMLTGVTPPDALERRAKYENQNKDILEEPHKIKKGISLIRENAILNALNVRIEDRTPDVATLLKELNAKKPAKRIYGKIKKIDLYRLPLWLKIAVPTILAAVAAFVALVMTGVIDLKVNQDPFKIPEGVVMVPDVEELPASQAITIIEESGLLAKTGGNVETPYVSAGTIVLQTPGTGTFMDKNGTVVLIVSSGGEIISPVAGKATVPYMIWDSVEAAKKKMAEAGLGEPEIEEAYDDNVAEGQIISQSLETGTEVEEGTVLKIVVSKGPAPFAMEEYSAKTEADAKEALEALGIKVQVEYESNNDVAEGTVLRQTPAAGEEIRRGDSVTLIVSSGKETIQLPDVKGKAQADAEKELKDLGFTVNVLENYDESIAKGLVVSQTPEAGTSQLYGSAVTLYVSKGKQNLVLHFDATGGSAVDDVTVKRGETYGTLPDSSRDGYIFEGWYTEAEGGSAVKADTKVSVEDDHTVYAHWSKVPETQAPTTTAAPTLSSISIKSNPSKTSYFVGENLNTSGLVLSTKYSDGSTKDVNSGFSCSPTTLNSAGNQTITVSYGGKTTTFTVSVSSITVTGISIKSKPSKTSYFVGETLNTSGLVLTATYNNGTSQSISSGFTCSPTSLNSAGNQTITVSYGGKTTTFTVSVSSVTVTGISIKSNPSKTSYFVGEPLNTSGLVLTATYNNGSKQDVSSGFTCSPTTLSSAGNQTITVTYGGKTATFTVSVSSVSLSSISIKSNPTKTSYFVGDTLDTSGLVLTASYNNGTTQDISSGFTCDPTSLSKAGNQTITVSYGGKTATFTVTVTAVSISSIKIKSNPTKTSYFIGDTLDTSGLVLTASYNNGTSQDVSSGFTCDPTALSKAGNQTITVSYGGKTATFTVTVTAVSITGIKIKSNPTKTSYFVGDSLDTSGLVITASYNNGTTKDVSSGFTCSPTTLNTAGNQTITVTYDGKTASFSVSVTVKQHTLSFNANGGSASTSSKAVNEGAAYGTLATATRDYYTFAGWFTAADGGSQVTESTVMGTSDVTVYAHWNLKPEQGWVLSSQVPSGAQITQTKYSYSLTETTESTSSSLSGWTQTGSYWNQTGSGTGYYGSFPSGWKSGYTVNAYGTSTAISTSNPYSASETTTSKRTVSTGWAGYVYWHWMYNVAYSTTTSRQISATKDSSGSLSFVYFYAFAHTTDAPYLDKLYQNKNTGLSVYNCNSILSSAAKKNAADGGAGNCRHFRFDYYKSTYTDYQKIFQYSRTTSQESTSYPSGSGVSNIQEWVKYRAK